jgi:hypothetical protein
MASGYNADVNNSVLLGHQAGYSATRDNTLYISNSGTEKPLIYGEFDTKVLTVHGKLAVKTKNPTELVDINGTDEAARFQLTSITNTSNQAAQFIQRRAHSSSGKPSAVQQNDNIGLFSFRGYTGTVFTGSKAMIAVSASEDWGDGANGTQMKLRVTRNGTDSMFTAFEIQNSGDVYIPEGNLYVKGTKMDVPDYVFKESYDLMPLAELERYIKEHSRLPGIASADEVGEKGVVNLSGLQMKLLEKVEELTLYTLEQERLLQARANEIIKLKKQQASQEKRLLKLEQALKSR